MTGKYISIVKGEGQRKNNGNTITNANSNALIIASNFQVCI